MLYGAPPRALNPITYRHTLSASCKPQTLCGPGGRLIVLRHEGPRKSHTAARSAIILSAVKQHVRIFVHLLYIFNFFHEELPDEGFCLDLFLPRYVLTCQCVFIHWLYGEGKTYFMALPFNIYCYALK